MEKLQAFAKSKQVEKLELVFKLCYLALVFISFNTIFARQWYLTTFSYVIVAVGLVVGLLRLVHLKDFLNRNVLVLILFVLSYVLSSINAMKYGYMENVQAIVWLCVQYFLVFAYDKTRSEESLKGERDAIFGFVLLYTGVVTVIGFGTMLAGWSCHKVIDGYNVYGGFVWNRLFGLYMDCNYGAVLAIVSILLSLFYYKNSKKFIKVLLVINIVLEYLFLCFSDSRTGMLAAAATGFIFTLTKGYDEDTLKGFYKSKKFWKTFVIAVLVAALIIGSVFLISKCSSPLVEGLAGIRARIAGLSAEETALAIENARIGRSTEQIGATNVSHGRFAIWGSAIDLFMAHPILGVSFRNNIETAIAEIPDTYIASAGYDSMHNAFFDILSSQGIVGSIIALVLIAFALITVAKTYNKYNEYKLSISIIVAIFVSMIFYSETFYMNTPGAFIFWYVLGFMINYEDKKCKKKD